MAEHAQVEHTLDAFLGGRIVVAQPRHGYRAGLDPVLLAASVPARRGQSVLELGCGVGVAALCLGARVAGLRLSGLELQPDYAALAQENARRNGIALEVLEGDVAAIPPALRQRRFDHVMLNPPWFDRTASIAAQEPGREGGLGEAVPLATWIAAAARRLAPRGRLSLIHRAERLPEILGALSGRLGSVEVLPLAPRAGRAAHLLLLRARKDGRAPFRLHAPVVLHQGDRHESDREDYTAAIRAVLREGSALPFPA
ncbi:MAG: tRNA1(Val) (adenine(37)-N6)-methyltransferase [Paracoccaceae bacterium]